MENDPRIEAAFLASALPGENDEAVKHRLDRFYDREQALYALLKKALSPEQYSLMLTLLEEIGSERDLTERWFFEQGWLMRGAEL